VRSSFGVDDEMTQVSRISGEAENERQVESLEHLLEKTHLEESRELRAFIASIPTWTSLPFFHDVLKAYSDSDTFCGTLNPVSTPSRFFCHYENLSNSS